MKKRIISLLLALIMALSLLPVSVLAADDHTGQVHVTVENTTWAKADGAEVDADTAECIVAKNRHGETSTVPLGWDGAHTRFMDVDFKR